jgi:hypothetical protein
MMPVIRISDAAFSGLKHIATWLDADTPAQTIDKLVHNEMERLGLERDSENESGFGTKKENGVLIFEKAPGLSFTRILSASVDHQKLTNANWAGLLLEAIHRVREKGFEGEQLVRELQVPAKPGRYEDGGYKFHSTLNISVQGQSASDAWKEIHRLAEKHGIRVEVEFQWRENNKAEHPNRIGRIIAGS